MPGFSTNKKTNHQISGATGYARAGQGGKRHRFDLSKSKPALDLPDAGKASDPDQDPGLDMLSGEGPMDQDPNMMPEPETMPHAPHVPPAHPPVAIHIHLSPSDHKAFKGMARSKPPKK